MYHTNHCSLISFIRIVFSIAESDNTLKLAIILTIATAKSSPSPPLTVAGSLSATVSAWLPYACLLFLIILCFSKCSSNNFPSITNPSTIYHNYASAHSLTA